MDKALYHRLREEARKKLDLARRLYKEDLEAIDRVCRLSTSRGSRAETGLDIKSASVDANPLVDPLAEASAHTVIHSFSGMVRDVIEERDGDFTADNVKKAIELKFPQAQIANKRIYIGILLRRFVKGKFIEIVKPHTATSLAVYRKTK